MIKKHPHDEEMIELLGEKPPKQKRAKAVDKGVGLSKHIKPLNESQRQFIR